MTRKQPMNSQTMNSQKLNSPTMNSQTTVTIDEMFRLKAKARGFSFLPRQPVTSLLAGRHASRLRGRGLAFEELRRYQEGDDIRSIDWKATARLRSTQVRVYSEERERPVLLVVDQRSSMFFGSRRTMKSVAAAELAALAAWRTLDAGDRVGGIVFNDAELVELPAHRSQTRVLRVLHEIVRQNQWLASETWPVGTVTLNDALTAALRYAKHDHLVVVISDLVGADEQTQQLATQLQAHNDVLIAAIYDPLGASLKTLPGMTAASGEERLELPIGQAFESGFQQNFTKLLQHWRTIFRALRIPILPISTAVGVADQLRDLFGQQAHAK